MIKEWHGLWTNESGSLVYITNYIRYLTRRERRVEKVEDKNVHLDMSVSIIPEIGAKTYSKTVGFLQQYHWFLPARLILDNKGFPCIEVIASQLNMGLLFYLYFVVLNDENESKKKYRFARPLDPLEKIILFPHIPNQIYGQFDELIEEFDLPEDIYKIANQEKKEEFVKTYPMLRIHLNNTYLD